MRWLAISANNAQMTSITATKNTTVIDDEWIPVGEVMPQESLGELCMTHFMAKLAKLVTGAGSWPFI